MENQYCLSLFQKESKHYTLEEVSSGYPFLTFNYSNLQQNVSHENVLS